MVLSYVDRLWCNTIIVDPNASWKQSVDDMAKQDSSVCGTARIKGWER